MERAPNHHGTITGPTFKHKHSSAHLTAPNHWFSMEIAAVRYAPLDWILVLTGAIRQVNPLINSLPVLHESKNLPIPPRLRSKYPPQQCSISGPPSFLFLRRLGVCKCRTGVLLIGLFGGDCSPRGSLLSFLPIIYRSQ